MLFIALSVIWGVPYLMIRVAVTDLSPVVVAGGRTTLGALLLLPLALFRHELGPAFRRWRVLLVYTTVEIIGPWLLLGMAETRLNSSTTGLLIAVVPLIAAVLVTMLGDDRLDRRRIVGLLIGFAGVAALVGLDIRVDDLLSAGFVFLAAVGYAIGPIIINRRLSDLPAIGVVTASLIVASVVYLPFVIWRFPDRVPADAAWSMVGLGVICTTVAFLVFFALDRRGRPGPRHGDHLHQSGGGHPARRAGAGRTVHHRHRDRFPVGDRRLDPGHGADPGESRRGRLLRAGPDLGLTPGPQGSRPGPRGR